MNDFNLYKGYSRETLKQRRFLLLVISKSYAVLSRGNFLLYIIIFVYGVYLVVNICNYFILVMLRAVFQTGPKATRICSKAKIIKDNLSSK